MTGGADGDRIEKSPGRNTALSYGKKFATKIRAARHLRSCHALHATHSFSMSNGSLATVISAHTSQSIHRSARDTLTSLQLPPPPAVVGVFDGRHLHCGYCCCGDGRESRNQNGSIGNVGRPAGTKRSSEVPRKCGRGATGGREVKQLLGDDAREGHVRIAELIQTHRYHLSSPGEVKVSDSSFGTDASPIEGSSHLPQYACMLSRPRSVRPALLWRAGPER
jgi:hypothetical protein